MHRPRPISALGVVGTAELRHALRSARDVWSIMEDPGEYPDASHAEEEPRQGDAFDRGDDRLVGIVAAVAIVGVALLAVAGSPLP